jgi:multisubunit Na+/H+ antiporter MnhC subunit
MEIIAIAVIALVGFWLFLFVFKRLLRMAIRLAVLGAIILALVAGAFAWWWYSPPERTPGQNRGAPARQTRPAR